MGYTINNQVSLAHTPQLDAFGRLRVSQPVTQFDSQQRFGLDPAFESNTSVSGGSISFIATQSSANLTVNNTNGAYAGRESSYVFKYQPGKSLLSNMTFVMAPKSAGNLRQHVDTSDRTMGSFYSFRTICIFVRDQVFPVQLHTRMWPRDRGTGTNLTVRERQGIL